MRRSIALFLLVSLAIAAPALAQGQQAGTLVGRVSTGDTLSLPGVAVTISSDALLGQRTAVTDVNGVFSVPGLPPGSYRVRFELDGMSTVEREVRVALGAVITLDQEMGIAPLREVVVVHGARPAPVTSPAGAFNARTEEFSQLPVARTPFALADLSPGLTDNTPNNNQVTIGGGFAYDNVFLMNGVDINDNVLGQPNALFIEDAIEEVQVLRSGIAAEYGRFGGGVVNIVTKSGGDLFSGSFRSSFTNPAWSAETPLENSAGISRQNRLSPVHQVTFGGPIVRERAWFFGGSRFEQTTTQGTFAQTRLPFTSRTGNRRFEGKVTGAIAPGHTVQGTVMDNTTDLVQPSFGGSIDPATMTSPSTLNRLVGATWRGALGSRTFATAQYSQKSWTLQNAGGRSTSILDSPILTRGVTSGVPAMHHYHAPYWDSTDPEGRNNRQLTGSLTQLLSSRRAGTHEVKAGFEHFVSTRVGGNSQTSTGYVFLTDYALGADGRPAIDADGRLVPRFVPGSSWVQVWQPLRGATIDITTLSFFVQDHWVATSRLTLDLGLRAERVGTDATGATQSLTASALVPRTSAAYDLTGDGRTILQATYGHYAGKYNDVQFARNSSVGNPDLYLAQYTGPAGEGRGFAPGFDPAQYTVPLSGTFPTANVFLAGDLRSPLTKEYTVAIAREIGRAGWARATWVDRRGTQFVEDFVTVEGGRTAIDRHGITGVFDNRIYRNTDLARRDYRAMEVHGAYRPGAAWSMQAHWTLQVRNHGNFEGEAPHNPAIGSLIGDYPEILIGGRSFPTGRLDDFQRHKVRAWLTYGLDLRRFGQIEVAPLYRYNSARTFSLIAQSVALTPAQVAANPGYARLPASQPVFFGERGSQSFEDFGLVDLAVTYGVPVWQSLQPWVKVEVLNLLNNQKVIAWDTSVTADLAGPKDEHGLPLQYIPGPRFGQATSNAHFPRPRQGMDGGRTLLVQTGVRF
jgi:hypothetical protein